MALEARLGLKCNTGMMLPYDDGKPKWLWKPDWD
jgi:hypothetical protein